MDFDPFAGPRLLGAVPSTDTQREIWTAAQVSGEANLAYNESISVRLRGELDRAALVSGLRALIRRHEVLRATFSADGLTLLLNETADVPLLDVDCTSRPEALAQLLEQVVREPFHLELGPLARAHLAKLGPTEHVLVFTAHHIVCDGWSAAVLVREWAELYSAAKQGRAPQLPDAPQFSAWARQMVEHRASAAGRDEEAWWLSRFTGEPPVLELPGDRPRPAVKTFTSLREDLVIPAEVIAELKKAGISQRASLFAMLLAGFQALLSRLTGQTDVVVGIPAAGQSADGFGGLVGHCVHVLPVRTQVDPEADAKAFVADVRKGLLDALEHQQLTLGSLIARLPIKRDQSRLPLVSVLFNVDRGLLPDAMPFDGLAASLEGNPRRYETYDLFVNAVELGPVVKLECQYNTDLFDAQTVRQWVGNYQRLLVSLSRALGPTPVALGALEVLSAEDEQRIAAWNQASALPVDLERTAEQLFEQQVDRTPDAEALVFAGRRVSYRELEGRANAIAAKLRELGAGPGHRVGICLERGPDLVASVFGVLKAGAAYVPLDPGFPRDRLAMMVEDSGLKVLLTSAELDAELALGARAPVKVAELPATAPRGPHAASPEGACYVIYTSGSTGKPKGVVIPHRAVVNFLAAMQREPGMKAGQSLLAVTTLSFDIAVLELYLPLTVGGRIVLAAREDVTDGARLLALLEGENVDVMQATPATWRLLLEAGFGGSKKLTALVGGEALPLDLAKTLSAKTAALWNMYGPTETTVWSTVWKVEPHSKRVLIGKPIANTQCHLLDANRRPVPIGVVAELWIAGFGVTTGYHERPELTAERFVSDPFSRLPGARMYRTGDLARWLPDGNLECLGRNDSQVKLRGYRIELGEIEEALNAWPAVRQAAVVLRELSQTDKRLVGYVVARDGMKIDEAGLRAQLKLRLPEYMVPAHLVTLEKMPLTPNGKIDRKALPAPDYGSRTEVFVAPRTPTETWLCGVWQELLKVARVGVTDDFFSLGGHSLLAAQLMARLGKERDIKLSLRRLFEAPTIEKLAQLIDAKAADAGTAVVTIPKRPDARTAPMSLMQRRLWYLHQLGGSEVGYNTPSAFRLHGPLDVGALERTLAEISRRHEVLRTSLADLDGVLVQRIDPDVRLTLERAELPGIVEAQRPAAIAPLLQREADRAFDLGQAPIALAKLFTFAPDDNVLFFMPHHIVWDGWSFDLFLAELSAIYGAFAAGKPSPLPEPEVQYGDFAAWHNGWLQGPELERQAEAWLKTLKAPLPALELSGDRPRPARMSGAGGFEPFSFTVAEQEAITRAARRLDATPYMVLLAAFDALLHRYTGAEDLLIGTPVRGRSQPQTEKTLGFFVNTLVLRTEALAAQRFDEHVAKVKRRVLDAFAHPDMPFELLVERLKLARDHSRTPIFQAMFSFQEASARGSTVGDLKVSQLHVMSQGAMTDLVFWLLSKREGLVGGVSYNADIFDPPTARRFLAHFKRLIAAAIEDPSRTLGELELVTPEEVEAMRGWNGRAVVQPAFVTAVQLFEAQVDRTPDAEALVHAGTRLTYRQLEARANAFAEQLLELGIGRDQRVGLCLERGPDLVAALLGILKTGAAYVPLDPGFPKERLEMMVEDAALAAIVTSPELERELGLSARHVVRPAAVAASAERPSRRTQPNAAAYVIYTSGSTGKPKGVVVPHRAVTNLLLSLKDEPGLAATDVLLAVTTLSFDIAVLELYLPLVTGARIVLASREDATDGARLLELMNAEKVTVLQATPATWRLLNDAGWQGSPGLKALIGGEALPLDLARTLAQKVSELWNMYGPTETTVWSTLWKVPPGASRVLIGRPLANTQCHVLDANRQPVPLGVVGELYLSGLGVATGYHARPELTAERFVADPFAKVPGATMYRTGDLARWLPDGQLECLGRTDFQVKLRGYRIELGEIENVLGQHPSVRQAAVVLRQLSPTDQRLVGYVVPNEGQTCDEAALRAHLEAQLPGYMVPAHVVTLDTMPLTPNGKIDRKQLPQGELGARTVEYVAPVTPTEQWLAKVWAELLKVERVGRADDFFTLGGHSLLAAQLVSRVARERKVTLPLRRVFEATSLAAQAALVDEAPARADVVIPRRSDPLQAPQSLMQRRLWYLEQLGEGEIGYHIPAVYRVAGPLDTSALERALAEISRRHEVLRTSFDDVGDQPIQRIHPDVRLELEKVELLGLAKSERAAAVLPLLQELADEKFDLRRAPVARAVLFTLAPDDHVLFFMTHHIIWDGWSLNLFMDELSAVYAAFSAGKPSPLPEPEVQYGDFAAWHGPWLQRAELQRQEQYWVQALKPPLETLALAEDRPRPQQMSGRGGFEGFSLTREEQALVVRAARKLDATPYMFLLAAFDALLFRYTGTQDVLVGTPVRGRMTPQVDGVLGFFVNTLVLRTPVDAAQRFDALLATVKQRVLDAFAHPDMPFELVVEKLKLPRDGSRTPVFQALFSFLEASGRSGRLGELPLEPIDVMPSGAITDLALWSSWSDDGLSGGLSYNSDIFDAATVRRMLLHYKRLVLSAAAEPALPVGELALVTEAELAAQRQWNEATRVPLPAVKQVHEQVRAQAAATPEALAAVHGATRVTYRELGERAHAVAHRLVAAGVQPGDLVGLCVERSTDMLAAMLGILEAGAAYVPLDPAYPPDRIAFMVEDAKLKAIITEQRVLDELELPEGAPRLLLEQLDRAAAAPPAIGPLDPERAAYVIYTSGSTGKPKGVMVPHRAVTNFLQSMRREPGLQAGDTVLAVTTLSFDIAVLELWLPLTCGARVVIAAREESSDAERLLALMAREKPTLLQATPVTWRMLLDGGWKGDRALKALVGGEALPLDLARRLVEHVGSLWNMYGPTETTVWSTLEQVKAPVERVLIGRPIDNTLVYVLDERLQPVPLGVSGELFIGGEGVTLGYLHRPELTRDRFRADPFAGKSGALMYRTGDLARFTPDGRIECLGRNDGQVKVRGHRIEVGEIETRLCAHPNVREACVVALADSRGEKRLVAYVVPKTPEPLGTLELRKHARRELPDYMVPNLFEELPALPRTPNGKVDRKALPAPSGDAHSETFVAPRSENERMVAEVWGQVLGNARAGLADNFFDLGGHSLLAFKVIAELERRTGKRVAARTLMLGTLEQVAAELPPRSRPGAPPPPPQPPKPPEPRGLRERLLGKVKSLVKR